MKIKDENGRFIEIPDEEIEKEREALKRLYVGTGKDKRLKSRYFLISMIIAFLVSLFFIMPSNIDSGFLDVIGRALLGRELLILLISGFLATYVTKKFFTYLRPEDVSRTERGRGSSRSGGSDVNDAVKILEKKLSLMQRQYEMVVNKLQNGNLHTEIFSEGEREQLLNELKEKIENRNFEEYFNKLSSDIESKLKLKSQEDIFIKIKSRLEIEVQSQSKRGNVNLLLGIVTTICGLGVLSYSVLQTATYNSGVDAIAHFLPRLSLVIVIEIFAYFFLRLYKQSLGEIKYFQNEITNIESKYMALCLSRDDDSREGLLSSVNELLRTERNFILEKGQSTTGAELKDVERSGSALAEKLAAIVSDLVKLK